MKFRDTSHSLGFFRVETGRDLHFIVADGEQVETTARGSLRALLPAIAQNLRNPLVQKRNLGIERELMNGFVAKINDDNSDVPTLLQNDNSAQENPNNNRNNRGPSQFDLRHNLVVTHTYAAVLPELGQPAGTRAARRMVVRRISTWRTGFPVNIFAIASVRGLTDRLACLGSGKNVDRPPRGGPPRGLQPTGRAGSAGAPSGTSVVNRVSISKYAQALGLSQPLLGNYGTLGRNVLRLNGQSQFDRDFYKNFHFFERVNVQFRAELYNIFNQHAFLSMASSSSVSQNARTGTLALRIVF